MKISKEEVLRLAEISKITIDPTTIDSIIEQLQSVLSYAQCVQEYVSNLEEQPSNRNINIFREDVVHPTPAESILTRAPEREENFFVVPSILESK
jgi:aspartyl-tRNA(Asn)/glutamyl-tRNA(Gln) amidotransferase subunit C